MDNKSCHRTQLLLTCSGELTNTEVTGTEEERFWFWPLPETKMAPPVCVVKDELVKRSSSPAATVDGGCGLSENGICCRGREKQFEFWRQ